MLNNLTVRRKIFLLLAIFFAAFVVFGALSLSTLNYLRVNGEVYNKIKSENDLLTDIAAPNVYLIEAVYNSMRLVDEEKPEKIQEFIKRIRDARGRYEERQKYWSQTLPDGEIKNLVVVKSHEKAESFLNITENELIPAVLAGDRQKANELSGGILRKTFIEHRNFVDEAEKLTKAEVAANEAAASSTIGWRVGMLIGIALLAAGLVAAGGYMVAQSILGPLAQVVDRLKGMARGDVSQPLEYKANDEIGELAESFRISRERLTDLIAEMRKVSRSAREGDIRARCETAGFEGAYAEMLGGTNDLLEAVGGRVRVAADRVEQLRGLCITNLGLAVKQMSEGDLKYEIVTGTNDLNDASPDAIGDLARSVDGIIAQTKGTVAAFEATRGTLRELIGETSGALGSLAEKDLTARISGEYVGQYSEIKTAFNAATAAMEQTMQQIIVGAEQVAAASGQISAGSQSLAEGASEQASTLEEVASSLQEIAGMSQRNAANSTEARSVSEVAREATERGRSGMEQLTAAVDEIKQSSDATARIVKTIEEIAFQTNLLALNAAVEAARAGDAGKGFAVVAEEVRNLAMRSAEAAKQTAELIEGSAASSDRGVELNAEVSRQLDEINSAVGKVAAVIAEIAAASEEQHRGVDQIGIAMEQMNRVTQQTAANSEESASAAEELSGQSQEMLSLIREYRLADSDGKTRRRQMPFFDVYDGAVS